MRRTTNIIDIYVQDTGDDTHSGEIGSPVKTLYGAFQKCSDSAHNRIHFINNGDASGDPTTAPCVVTLIPATQTLPVSVPRNVEILGNGVDLKDPKFVTGLIPLSLWFLEPPKESVLGGGGD